MLIELIDDKTNNPHSTVPAELYENSERILTHEFQLAPEDAKKLLERVSADRMQSLWHIYVSFYSRFKEILAQLMEKMEGNIQLVEDIIKLDVMIWKDRKGAWEKFRIPTYNGIASTVLNKTQTTLMLAIGPDFLEAFIKPLRNNLTLAYQSKYPDKKVKTGRDLEKFRKYAYLEKTQTLPPFMFENTNALAPLSATAPANYSLPLTVPAQNESNNENLNSLLAADIVMLLVLVAFFIRLLAPLVRCKNFFFKPQNDITQHGVSDPGLQVVQTRLNLS